MNWTEEQQTRLRECIDAGDTITYWCSDAHGRPANGGTHDGWTARPGLVQRVPEATFAPCTRYALHGTDEPHRWAGARVWVVAMRGRVERQIDKIAATVRETLGEVLPEHAWSPSVGVRIGRKDLIGANLVGANLDHARLDRARLDHARLVGAGLVGANLVGANLDGASLDRARLDHARLDGASLDGASLDGASLDGANLVGANLDGASLDGASLDGANLVGASLDGASLDGASLDGASLDGATCCVCCAAPTIPPEWEWVKHDGRRVCRRRGAAS